MQRTGDMSSSGTLPERCEVADRAQAPEPQGASFTAAPSSAAWEPEDDPASEIGHADPCRAGLALERNGKHLQAIRAYREGGASELAARLARRLGRHEQAARYYAEADMPYEAAASYIHAKLVREALEQLVRVPDSSPHYRAACVHAIRLCHRAGTMNQSVLAFLRVFLATPSGDDRETETVLLLGEILESRSMIASAREVYRCLVGAPQSRASAEARLRQLAGPAEPAPVSPEIQSPATPPNAHVASGRPAPAIHCAARQE